MTSEQFTLYQVLLKLYKKEDSVYYAINNNANKDLVNGSTEEKKTIANKNKEIVS